MNPLASLYATDVPVDPAAPEARQWLNDELAKPSYQAARPTWFDLASRAVRDWLGSLFSGSGNGVDGGLVAVLAVAVVAIVVAGFLIFGMPRLNRRSTAAGEILGADDRRDAAAMRKDAEIAAGARDWTLAIEELFRALAKGLAERTIVTVNPGTTAHDFGVRASAAFPQERARLGRAASVFDGVRYLDAQGTEQDYVELASLERALRAARPAQLVEIGGARSPV
ncbi:MAG TPA: DUF4129 domain-containing protein [Microbacteriaceae bacterium]|jgi:hypothetical protein|nr:DUF4129 domain-containing protein [Microbacteriaceae bacterium]